jgi:N6-adenosine-specific RNA methylase IME4/ParB-like chromosome segregation protein Spo0J
MSSQELDISEIKIGTRFRKDIGDISSLAQSIREVGLLHSIVVDSQKNLIAGYRRIKAVQTLGWTRVPVHTVDLKDLLKGEFHENAFRKDFAPSEWVAIKRALEPKISADAEEREKAGIPSSNLDEGRTDEKIASFVGVGKDTLRKSEAIVEAAEKEPEKYALLLEKVDDGTISVDKAFKGIRRDEQLAELKEIAKNLPKIEGKYDVIIVDPPWPYGTEYDSETRRCASPYPEISLEEIRNLKLPANDKCVLWLWTTNRFLHDAFHILEAWGYTPKTVLTWGKYRMGTGDWLRGQTEHCILGIHGNPRINLENQSTLLIAKSGAHSQKPNKFYQLVDAICFGKKLDYYAREKRQGWDVYGTLERTT